MVPPVYAQPPYLPTSALAAGDASVAYGTAISLEVSPSTGTSPAVECERTSMISSSSHLARYPFLEKPHSFRFLTGQSLLMLQQLFLHLFLRLLRFFIAIRLNR